MTDIDATNYTIRNQIIHNEAEVNGRLIYTTCRKLFHTIFHICIKHLHYHRRQACTRLTIMK